MKPALRMPTWASTATTPVTEKNFDGQRLGRALMADCTMLFDRSAGGAVG